MPHAASPSPLNAIWIVVSTPAWQQRNKRTSPRPLLVCATRTLSRFSCSSCFSQVTCELKASAAAARVAKAEAEARAARETAARELTEARGLARRRRGASGSPPFAS